MAVQCYDMSAKCVIAVWVTMRTKNTFAAAPLTVRTPHSHAMLAVTHCSCAWHATNLELELIYDRVRLRWSAYVWCLYILTQAFVHKRQVEPEVQILFLPVQIACIPAFYGRSAEAFSHDRLRFRVTRLLFASVM